MDSRGTKYVLTDASKSRPSESDQSADQTVSYHSGDVNLAEGPYGLASDQTSPVLKSEPYEIPECVTGEISIGSKTRGDSADLG